MDRRSPDRAPHRARQPAHRASVGTRSRSTAALQQFYADARRRRRCTCRWRSTADEREPLEAWLSERAGRRVRIVVPQRGEKRGLVELAMRNAALAYQTHFGEGARRRSRRSTRCASCLHLPTLPRRIECFDISTLQGTRDGRLDGRVRWKAGCGEASTASSAFAARSRRRRPAAPSAGRLRVDGRGRAAPVSTAARAGRAVSGPDLIDGGKGQLTAAYAALRELGLERLVAVGLAKQEELLFTRDRVEGIALPHESRRAAAGAAHSRRGAPVRA